MAALTLDDPTAVSKPLFDPADFTPAPPDRGVSGIALDQLKGLHAGLYDVGAGLTGAAEALTGPDDPGLDVVRDTLGGWRRGAKKQAQDITETMSPQAQRRSAAKIIPGAGPTIWGEGVGGALEGIALKVSRSAPSVVASVLGTVFGGGVTGYGIAGALTAGQTYNDIRDSIEQMPSGELAEKNSLYAGYLDMGLSEKAAREKLLYEVGANKALLMGTLTAATSKYLGVEGRIAGSAAGATRGRLAGAAGEAVQEGVEQVGQSALTYLGQTAATGPAPFDWHDLANQTAESMLVGGVMGGALGGHGHAAAVSPEERSAVTTDGKSLGVVNDDGLHAVVPQEHAVPGGEVAVLDTNLKATDGQSGIVAQTPSPDVVPKTATGLAPDEQAALEYGHDAELGESPESGLEPAIPPVPQVPVVASPLAEAIGAEPVPQSAAVAETPQAAPVEAVAPATRTPEEVLNRRNRAAMAANKAREANDPAALEAANREFVAAMRELEKVDPETFQHFANMHGNRVLYPELLRPAAATEAPGQALAPAPAVVPDVASEATPAPAVPTGRVLEGATLREAAPVDIAKRTKQLQKKMSLTAAREQAQAEYDAQQAGELKPETFRNKPRQTASKKAQLAAGVPEEKVLGAKELAKQKLVEARTALAERAKTALAETTFPAADAADSKAIRSYAKAIVEKAQRGDISLANLPADAHASLRLLKAAEQIAKGAASAETKTDFMTNAGMYLRGDEGAIGEQAQAKAPGGPSLIEEMAPPSAVGTGMQENVPEQQVVEDLSKRMRKASMLEARTARDLKRAKQSQRAGAEEAAEQAKLATFEGKEAVGVVGAAARVPVVETRKARVLNIPKRGADPAVTKRAEGTATARTPSEAINQIKRAAVETATAEPATGEPEVQRAAPRAAPEALPPGVRSQSSLGELLRQPNELLRHATGEHRLTLEIIANRARQVTPDTKVTVVSNELFENLYKNRKATDTGRSVAEFAAEAKQTGAVYRHNANEIILRDEYVNNPRNYAYFLLHESAHAVYIQAMERSPEMQAETKRLMEAVEKQYNNEMREKGEVSWELPYGLTHIDEFVAETWANQEFRNLLKRTSVEVGRGNALFGEKISSAYMRLISMLSRVFMGPKMESAAISAVRVTRALDAIVDLHGTRPDMRGPPRAPSAAPRGGPLVRAADVASDGTTTVGRLLRGIGIKGATGQMLSDVFDKYFGHLEGKPNNPIARLNVEHDAMRVLADKEIAKGMKPVEAFITTIQAKDPDEAAAIATLAHNATKANVNVIDKANATMADLLKANPHLGDEKSDRMADVSSRDSLRHLQDDFMKLKPESRKWLLDTTQMLRDIQNRNTKAIVGKLIAAIANPDLTVQQLHDLQTRTMTGKLTDEDSELISDKSLLKAMARAQEFRLIDGLYVPLMRRGDHVVQTMDRMGDLGGGKMVADDILEFTAPSGKDKDARQMLRDWSKQNATRGSQKMEVMGVGKQRRLTDGTVVSEVDARSHDHTVSYRARVQRKGLFTFESDRLARKFIEEHKNDFEKISAEPEPKKAAFNDNSMTSANMQTILAALNARTDVDQGTKNYLGGLLQEASVRQLSGNRFQQRALPRRRVRGHDEDLARNLRDYVLSASYSYARTRHMDPIRAIMKEMNDYADASAYQPDNGLRRQVIKELEARVNTPGAVGEDLMPQWARNAMALSFMARLAYPGFSVVNAGQPFMATLPVIGARYGNLRATAALVRAYSSVGGASLIGSGLYNTFRTGRRGADTTINSTKMIEHVRSKLAKEPDAALVLAAFNEAVDRGKVDDGSLNEMIGIASGRGAVERGIAKADRITRQLPLAVETLNRAVTVVATARLAKASGMSSESAVQEGFRALMNTQGDYGAFNNPRFFQNKYLTPALQFKRYALMTGNILVDMVRRAKWGSPEEKRAAYKQIMNTVGVQIAMAGAMGLPGWELIKVGFMLTAAMGFSDGWEEQQRRLRRLFESAIGKGATEKAMFGVLSRALNIDLSAKLSMSDMATFGEPKTYDAEGIAAYFGRTIGGAPASLAIDMMQGVRLAMDDKPWEGFQKFVPLKIAADISKAMSQSDKLYAAQTPFERGLQGFGFRSGRMSEEGAKVGESIATGKRLEENAKKLRQRYEEATTAGERLKVKNDIAAHNKAAEIAGRNKLKLFASTIEKYQGKRREAIEALRR